VLFFVKLLTTLMRQLTQRHLGLFAPSPDQSVN
jgi:hypothetical protein